MSSSSSVYREYWNLPYGKSNNQLLYARSKDCLDFVKRMNLEAKLEVHNGCVNSICWNEVGTRILSGSDDQHLCITDPFTRKLETSIQSGHLANIFSAKFLPNTQDAQVVSCSGDGMIYYTIVDRPDQYGQHPFDCHFGTTYEIVTVPQDSHTFLSCGEDGSVRWFDLRIKDKCNKEDCKDDILINCRRAVTSLAINPCKPYQLGVGCSDSSVRIFDRRMLGTRATGNYTGRSTLTGMMCRFTPPLLEQRSHRITSLSYSSDGTEVLASYSSEKIYLFNISDEGKKELTKDLNQAKPQDASGTQESSPRHPPIKRLRLRGDWSDTGPNARPERERSQPTQGEEEQPAAAVAAENNPPEAPADASADRERRSMTIMQRMSDMLTRWLEGASRAAGAQGQAPAGSEGQGQTEGQENEGQVEEPGQAESQDTSEGDNQGQSSAQNEGQADQSQGQEGPGQIQGQDDNQGHTEDLPEGSGSEGKVAQKPVEVEVQSQSQGTSEEKLSGEVDEGQEVKLPQCKEVTKEDEVPSSEGKPPVPPKPVRGREHNDSESSDSGERGVRLEQEQDTKKEHLSAIAGVSVIVKDNSDSEITLGGEVEGGGEGVASSNGEASDSDSTSDNEQSPAVGIDRRSGTVVTHSVEPLVSLHYKSEGTTSGMISLDYPASGTQQGPNLPPGISDYSDQTGPELPRGLTDHTDRTTPQPDQGQTSKATPDRDKTKHEGSQEKDSSCKKEESENNVEQNSNSVESGNCDSENAKSEPVSDKVETDGATGGVEEKVDSEKNKATTKKAKSDTAKLVRSLSDTGKDSSPTSPSDDLEMLSADESFNVTTVKTLRYNPDDDPTSSPSSGDEMPRRLSDGNVPGPSGVARPAGGRRRRHGHSGPPTGDFQLFSGSEDSDNDDDEGAEERAAQRDRDEVERNLAALRLQELYRKRQAEREKEDQLLMNIHQPAPKYVYSGHRNARTMIKEATFWGERYVMSGSDCGHIFVWDRFTSELVMFKEADKHVVNCLQPHPTDPVLASSGIDYDIKLWMPTAEKPCFDSEKAEEVVRRNQLMLEETRDTITVPASFMLRMLASLNHIRSGRRQGNDGSNSSSSEEE